MAKINNATFIVEVEYHGEPKEFNKLFRRLNPAKKFTVTQTALTTTKTPPIPHPPTPTQVQAREARKIIADILIHGGFHILQNDDKWDDPHPKLCKLHSQGINGAKVQIEIMINKSAPINPLYITRKDAILHCSRYPGQWDAHTQKIQLADPQSYTQFLKWVEDQYG